MNFTLIGSWLMAHIELSCIPIGGLIFIFLLNNSKENRGKRHNNLTRYHIKHHKQQNEISQRCKVNFK